MVDCMRGWALTEGAVLADGALAGLSLRRRRRAPRRARCKQ